MKTAIKELLVEFKANETYLIFEVIQSQNRKNGIAFGKSNRVTRS